MKFMLVILITMGVSREDPKTIWSDPVWWSAA